MDCNLLTRPLSCFRAAMIVIKKSNNNRLIILLLTCHKNVITISSIPTWRPKMAFTVNKACFNNNAYFHYWLFCPVWWIQTVQFNKQSKTLQNSVCYHIWQRKAENSHILDNGTDKSLAFLPENSKLPEIYFLSTNQLTSLCSSVRHAANWKAGTRAISP